MAASAPYRAQARVWASGNCGPLQDAARRHKVTMSARARSHYPGSSLPPNALPGLRTAGYWDARCDQDWGLPEHRDDGLEITFLETGLLGVTVEGAGHCLAADDLTVTRPWQWHSVGSPSVASGRLHWVILDVGVRRPDQSWKWPAWVSLSEEDRAGLIAALSAQRSPVLHAPADMRRVFQALAGAVRIERDARCVSHLAVRLNELLLLLLESLRGTSAGAAGAAPPSLQQVERFLAELYAGTIPVEHEWTVERMAHSCGLAATQFGQHVRRITNLTPAQYLTECRLHRALGLLERTCRTVTGIALECGFSSGQYFATVFRQRFGCTPRDYRLQRDRAASSSNTPSHA